LHLAGILFPHIIEDARSKSHQIWILMDLIFVTGHTLTVIHNAIGQGRRSRWPRGLSRDSAAACFLGLQVRIPQGAGKSISWECCVLLGRFFSVQLIARPEESYRMWYVWVWSWRLDNEEALAH